mgnify:CR=1 FL=1
MGTVAVELTAPPHDPPLLLWQKSVRANRPAPTAPEIQLTAPQVPQVERLEVVLVYGGQPNRDLRGPNGPQEYHERY